MLFTVTETNANGVAEAVEYPLSFEDVHGRFLAPLGKSKTDVDITALAAVGVFPVRAVDAPPTDYTSYIKSVLPIFVGGEWVESYVTVSKTEEEIAADRGMQEHNIRNYRQIALGMCDWTQMADSPLSAEKKQQWAVYRQALRDITSQEGFPFEINWPTQP